MNKRTPPDEAQLARVRQAGLLTLALGGVLVVVATVVLIIAPEGATMSLTGRRGTRNAEFGLWALYIPAVAAAAIGAWAKAKPAQISPDHRGVRVVIAVAIIAIAAQIIATYAALS